ncbi:hypothetical protein Taro_037871 [Colocasia esculenta]|uniref:Uncharacterized protein n=1 Tax=Colocasia esculenta TaxID=4460 RepID=A0A843WB27_COLES|nr:hypothetical protein [Colocasia esculenta]
MSSGRGSSAASASGPSSVPPPLAAGSGQFTPPPPTVAASGPPFVPPPLAAGPSVFTPPAFLAGVSMVPVAEDVVSLPERGGRFYNGSLFNDFQMNVQELLYQMFMSNYRFTRPSDEVRSRSVWTTTTRSNYKHLLYNARKNAQRVCQSPDPTLWRERTPTWMRREYWEGLCNIWAAKRWLKTSTTMKVNRAANPEANKHISGSVSFATHQSRLE